MRRAELFAMAQNAQVGVAKADLYPSFSINGSLGVAASGDTTTTRTGDSGIGELFRSESVTYTVGPSFVWPFLNYDRIKNNIRVQDARLQQALVQYQETVIQAARDVEDAMVAFVGSQQQDDILTDTVESAKRSTELSMVRYQEGFADYQRVLDAQQALFAQQQRYVSNKGLAIQSLIGVLQVARRRLAGRGLSGLSMRPHVSKCMNVPIGTVCWKLIETPLASKNDRRRQ